MEQTIPRLYRKGRGAVSNPDGRFEPTTRVALDDGWGGLDAEPAPLRTTVQHDRTRSVITRNSSPDVPFDRSINPYRGCEHGSASSPPQPSSAFSFNCSCIVHIAGVLFRHGAGHPPPLPQGPRRGQQRRRTFRADDAHRAR